MKVCPAREKYNIKIYCKKINAKHYDENSGIHSAEMSVKNAGDINDEKHICPLQLEVIRRAVKLWSNPGEIVFSPFGGIGSEPYVALEQDRRAVACELKPSYFEQLVKNCTNIANNDQMSFWGSEL